MRKHLGGGYRAAGKRSAIVTAAIAYAGTGQRALILCRREHGEMLVKMCLAKAERFGYRAVRDGFVIHINDVGSVEIGGVGRHENH